MSKQEKAEKPNKSKFSSKVKSFAIPFITVLAGVVALAVLLGLAGRGLALYLTDINDEAKTIASIIGVSVMASAVLSAAKTLYK